MSHFPMVELSVQELNNIKMKWLWIGLIFGGVITLLVCALLGLWID